MDKEYSITVEHLTKTYKIYDRPLDRMKEALKLTRKPLHTEFYAVNDVSFSLEKGEILGIMGRNGAGKSTLLKMITGVLTPSAGKVETKGRVSSLLELGAGFNMEYTGVENVYFYGTLMGIPKETMDEQLQEICEFSELGDYVLQPVKTYSSGMFARLAFSCAINIDPDILIVDEILSVGDIRFQAKCFNKFKEFKKKGITILYVGHDISMMRTFCDTCLWMHNGFTRDYGEPLQISSRYTEFMYQDSGLVLRDKAAVLASASDEVLENQAPETSFQEEGGRMDYETAKKHSHSLAHWGSCLGIIKNPRLEKASNKVDFFYPDDEIQICCDLDIPSHIDTDNFSLAFSIKSREGIDLIVKSTAEENIEFSPGKHQVCFSLRTQLTKGEYYLVFGAENRENPSIAYYEYIEGAQYFQVYQDQAPFGLFLPKTEITVKNDVT